MSSGLRGGKRRSLRSHRKPRGPKAPAWGDRQLSSSGWPSSSVTASGDTRGRGATSRRTRMLLFCTAPQSLTWHVKTPLSRVVARSMPRRRVYWSRWFLATREVHRERNGTSGSTGKPSLNQCTDRALEPTAMQATISSSPTRGVRGDTCIISMCIAGSWLICRNSRSTAKGPSLPPLSASSRTDSTVDRSS